MSNPICDWFGIGCSNPTPGSQQIVTVNSIRYTRSGDQGWLKVKVDATNDFQDLCEYTKVKILGESNGRVHFKVEDSNKQGLIVSLASENARTYLTMEAPEQRDAILNVTYRNRNPQWPSPIKRSDGRYRTFDQQMASISFPGGSATATLNSSWGGAYTPIPVGTYNIMIPDYPHSQDYTETYRLIEPELKHDIVWFPIEHEDNSRYVHVGNISNGCVTVLTLNKWSDIYRYLIRHRTPGGKYVGKLIVT